MDLSYTSFRETLFNPYNSPVKYLVSGGTRIIIELKVSKLIRVLLWFTPEAASRISIKPH